MANNIKKYFIALLFLIGFILGASWYRYRVYPFYIIKNYLSLRNSKLIQYTKNTYIFSDRIYVNLADDARLEGMYLIQVPRHCKKTLVINAKKKISIFRLIMSKNIDKFPKWHKTNIKVEIQGYSGTHDTVITKAFSAGKIVLANYEWVFAPALIKTKSPDNISFYFE